MTEGQPHRDQPEHDGQPEPRSNPRDGGAGRPRRLHTQLLAAFGLVIAVTLLSAGSATVWLIQEYQRQLAVDRLSELAIAASLIGRQLELSRDTHPSEIVDILANQLAPAQLKLVRILVLDAQDRVVAVRPGPADDGDADFVGRKLVVPAQDHRHTQPGRPLLFKYAVTVWTPVTENPTRSYTYITAPVPPSSFAPPKRGPVTPAEEPALDPLVPDAQERLATRRPTFRVVLAIPPRRLAAWLELAPGLGLAALVALPVSVAVALWLSRSITRPLSQITRAAEGIARGNLRQEIPIEGSDEVAKLAQAFNVMSHEVERSHRALRDFLANASHELRTPLTSIQGFSQALMDGTLSAEGGGVDAGTINAGTVINEEAVRMSRLVEDLLYLSRVENRSGNVAATWQPVDVAGLLREASRRLQLIAERRELHVALDLPDLPPVDGDADELDHLFGNLLENAGKYTPPGGTITVTARPNPASVVVTVHNTGSVIPPGDLTHIFERFYRVDKSRARDVDGSGLGLAIAQEVVQRHKGTIEVRSTPATGTEFVVTLPRRAVGAPEPFHPAAYLARDAAPASGVRTAETHTSGLPASS